MIESKVDSGKGFDAPLRDKALMARALQERWHIPEEMRAPLIERLYEIIKDPEAETREVLSAVGALMTASKINLANIACSINAEKHEELEKRMTEIERQLVERSGKASA